MRLFNIISAVIAASVGLVILIGLFFTEGLGGSLVAVLLQVIAVTAALAVLIGIVNLLQVHLRRMLKWERGALYSGLVLVTASGVILVRVLDLRTNDGTNREVSTALFRAVQLSLESALAGLLFFFLVYAAYRMMRRRVSSTGCLFTGALLLALMGWVPMGGPEVFANLRNWLLEIPVMAGSRGILIGIGLATVMAGLRVLIGQERAYREE